MKPKTTDASRRPGNVQGEGSNWIVVVGGALLSTLSFHLVCKLKQGFVAKQPEIRGHNLKGSRNVVELKRHFDDRSTTEPEASLPLVTILSPEFNKENGVIWSTSPDRLELPQKSVHQSNSSDSPCVSESGSDFFGKREVIQKLRQQLKRRDDTIIEMNDQIEILRNSYSTQLSHSSHLQSLIDAANRDLFDSEREIQRLRKIIADHCKFSSGEKFPNGHPNGYPNGYLEVERNLEAYEKLRVSSEKIDLLSREVNELKELIDGKDYLLQSYKEQKCELSLKIKELQQRLDAQLPSIL